MIKIVKADEGISNLINHKFIRFSYHGIKFKFYQRVWSYRSGQYLMENSCGDLDCKNSNGNKTL